MTLRAITLTQPWCGLMAAGIKRIENRTRPLIKRSAIGTDIAFHASREIDESVYARIFDLAPGLRNCGDYFETPWYTSTRITSAITHVATLVDVLATDNASGEQRRREFDQAVARGTVTADQWRWYFGRYGYVFDNERVIASPVKCRGWQGCWRLDEETERRVMEQIR